ncbi:site-specific integrase [Salmonella enterica]|nr:site-specific integrase [Salmonella enterica]EGR8499859.1 site-specific integrase [Salmonella enterica]EII5453602.1 site-specific integrase [Salmonella enterica]
MRLFYTTPDFVYKGRICTGLPFLCNDDMTFMPVANDYLLWVCLENASTANPATWKSYAETLFDYFSWLSTNGFAWDALPIKGPQGEEISNLAMYRNWSMDLIHPSSGKPCVAPSTLRRRMTQIMAFYRWALQRKRIPALPWETTLSRVLRLRLQPSMYRHTHAGEVVYRDITRPSVPKKPIPFLHLDQCRALMQACRSETLKLMTALMLQTGLRNEECRTFPRQYIFDPVGQPRDKRFAVELSPSDMAIKGSKPRRIYLSWWLMKSLFDYLNFGQGARRAKRYRQTQGEKSPFVFLNQAGTPWSEKGLNNAYRKLWAAEGDGAPRLDFRVTPHQLRHTFATLELYAESQNNNLATALAWVRDRLGHSSIQTTTVYVHCLDLMGESDLNLYQREIDALLEGRHNESS